MKWKTRKPVKNMEWEKVFVIFPKHTQDGYTVTMQYVWRRWKIHMDGGKYVYVTEAPEIK